MEKQADYRPKLAVSEAMEPFLKQLEPGNDGVPAGASGSRSSRRGSASCPMRFVAGGGPRRGRHQRTARSGFRGARLVPIEAAEARSSAARREEGEAICRAIRRSTLARSARNCGGWSTMSATSPWRSSSSPRSKPDGPADPPSALRTTVRYDIVGAGTNASASSTSASGRWDGGETRQAGRSFDGRPRRTWSAARDSPIFTEITAAALGGNDSFRRQLNIDLDSWMATFDSVLTRDSNGHQGVSVGDADGDGLDDLYVAQPAGLPNRLYRNRGDSTFEDITDEAGVGVLDDTAQSLFVDVDNDGDQDLVVATSTNPLLFINDGKGHFTPVQDAFRFARPLQGVLTSITMADYDRDGFLDLYVCVYSYFFGAGEDKAGTPAPYLRRTQRTARLCSFATTATGDSSTPPRTRVSTPATIAITSRRPGPTTTATAGRIFWSRTTSGPRTCITTSGVVTAR